MRVEPASTPEDDDATEVDTNDRAQTNEGRGADQRMLEVGDRFGAYEIRGLLGRGAMGVVYDAWDTTLERRVALKLLRWHRKRSAERLVREARALARLDHPNVVKIWAAGVHRGSLYIAMERVEGQNLREWLKVPRTWNQVLPVMIAAGRGLAAAHEARVVHRDFKPENVLVGWDGRARVVDFGIARISPDHPDHLGSSAEITSDGESSGLSSLSGFDLSTSGDLTEKGSLIGTVRYMSPEQHEREAADERSDQYGFCLTLFEAVYGAHPFPARSQAELAIKVAERDLSFPSELPVPPPPRWLRKLIVQGLAPDPRDRHASMSELVGELERYPARRRARRRMLAVGALVAAAVSVGLILPDGRASEQLCIDVAHEAEARIGSEAREPIAGRYAGVRADWATPMAAHVERELATWMGAWVEARTEVCELRHGHRDETQLDQRREQCLAAQLDEVAALTEVLGAAEADTLMNAPRMLLALPDPRRCNSDDPPEAVVVGSEAGESLHQQLIRLRWLAWAGGDVQARGKAESLVAAVRELSSSEPEVERAHALLLADALIVLAVLESGEGRRAPAERSLREASRIADRHDADQLRARALVDLGWLLATTPGRADEGSELLADAAALIERVGIDAPTQAIARQAEGEALLALGEPARARAVLEGLVAELEPKAELDPLGYATAIDALARVGLVELDYADAHEQANRAITAIEGHLGPAHPLLASPLNNAGLALTGLGRTDEARASYERSLALRRAQLQGSSDPGTTRLLVEGLTNLANLESAAGLPEAVEHYQEALAKVDLDQTATLANLHYNLGVHHQLAGHYELAHDEYREALRLALPIFADRSHEIAGARLGVGSCLVELGRFAEASEPLERALATWPEVLVGTLDEAELRLALARVRLELEGPSTDTRALLDDARSVYLRHGETAAVDRIDALR
ncbi:protein kinase domain-containing protein [Nannocystaceae bacterium ST9]